MKATQRTVGLICHLMHSSGLYEAVGMDGVSFMEFAEGLEQDTASDLIDALKRYDAGYGNENEADYITGQILHLK